MTSIKKHKRKDEIPPPVPPISTKRKNPLKKHPWEVSIKDYNSQRILRAHNSVGNPIYPKPKERPKPFAKRMYFTVIGIFSTKEFIYCVNMVQGMNKYRCQSFGPPIIQGFTTVEWPYILKKLEFEHGEEALCLRGPVAVLKNNRFFGGIKELKDFIESRYIYHLALNYGRESIDLFRHFIKQSGVCIYCGYDPYTTKGTIIMNRPCAYFHITVDGKPIGCLMFMLYLDKVPCTCENFLRLCQTTKGGYSGTPVHRIVEGGWIQCGGFALKDVPLGCENFVVPHDRRGVLGMCNADRGVDCSTQFFVLLQPALWMNHKYVAFGQLIDGEETLKKIEQIPTFYESPTKNIVIVQAGILNIECDDIMVNRGAVAYIDGHIEDLVPLGEMLYEVLIAKARGFARVDYYFFIPREPCIFLGKKWLMELVGLEIQFRYLRNLELTGEGESHSSDSFTRKNAVTGPRSVSGKQDDNVNNDFDVEDYQPNEFEGEAYSYDKLTVSSSIVEKRPFYIPLTDVLYPGERDSNFDLKRFLQGDYCLHADLNMDMPKNIHLYSSVHNALAHKEKQYSILSESEFLQNIDDLDDEDREIVQEYIRNNVDKVSFAGDVVSHMAKNLLKDDQSRSQITSSLNDEDLRRIRMAFQNKLKPGKLLEKDEFDKKYSFESIELKNDQQDDFRKKTATPSKVVIQEPVGKLCPQKIRRRQTGFIKQKDFPDLDESDDDVTSERKEERQTVRIDGNYTEHEVERWNVKPTSKIRQVSVSQEVDYENDRSLAPYDKVRPSVLLRLYDDLAVNDDDEKPTLKDFKPKDIGCKDSLMLLSDNPNGFLKKSHKIDTEDSNSVEVNAESRHQSAYSRRRPSMSVSAYRKKNQIYAEKMKQELANKGQL